MKEYENTGEKYGYQDKSIRSRNQKTKKKVNSHAREDSEQKQKTLDESERRQNIHL